MEDTVKRQGDHILAMGEEMRNKVEYKNTALEARCKELDSALKFYSIKARYKNGWSSRDKHVMNDYGDIARKALSTTPTQSLDRF